MFRVNYLKGTGYSYSRGRLFEWTKSPNPLSLSRFDHIDLCTFRPESAGQVSLKPNINLHRCPYTSFYWPPSPWCIPAPPFKKKKNCIHTFSPAVLDPVTWYLGFSSSSTVLTGGRVLNAALFCCNSKVTWWHPWLTESWLNHAGQHHSTWKSSTI